jgi:hypothetical protein
MGVAGGRTRSMSGPGRLRDGPQWRGLLRESVLVGEKRLEVRGQVWVLVQKLLL